MGIRFTCGHCGHQLHVKTNLAGKRGICPKCQGRIDIPAEAPAMAHAPQASGSTSSGEIHMTPNIKARTPAPGARSGSSGELPVIQQHPVAQQRPAAQQQPVIAPAATLPPAATDPIAEAPHLSWYVVHAGSTTQYGPAPGAMFRAWVEEGRVSPESMVWRQDWAEWQRAGDVLPQLSAIGTATAFGQPGASGPAVVAGSPWPGGSAANPSSYPTRKRMGTNTMIAILVTIFLALIPVVWLVLNR